MIFLKRQAKQQFTTENIEKAEKIKYLDLI